MRRLCAHGRNACRASLQAGRSRSLVAHCRRLFTTPADRGLEMAVRRTCPTHRAWHLGRRRLVCHRPVCERNGFLLDALGQAAERGAEDRRANDRTPSGRGRRRVFPRTLGYSRGQATKGSVRGGWRVRALPVEGLDGRIDRQATCRFTRWAEPVPHAAVVSSRADGRRLPLGRRPQRPVCSWRLFDHSVRHRRRAHPARRYAVFIAMQIRAITSAPTVSPMAAADASLPSGLTGRDFSLWCPSS